MGRESLQGARVEPSVDSRSRGAGTDGQGAILSIDHRRGPGEILVRVGEQRWVDVVHQGRKPRLLADHHRAGGRVRRRIGEYGLRGCGARHVHHRLRATEHRQRAPEHASNPTPEHVVSPPELYAAPFPPATGSYHDESPPRFQVFVATQM